MCFILDSTLRQALDQIAQESAGLEKEESLLPNRNTDHQDQVDPLSPDFVGSYYKGRTTDVRPCSVFLTKI
jgi:hypothetical protein